MRAGKRLVKIVEETASLISYIVGINLWIIIISGITSVGQF